MAGDGAGIVPRRLEEMAARYVQELRTVQRHGPYLIGGWCLGGDVAFEMAQQLQTAGEEVAMLVMVDNPRPEFVAPERAAPLPARLWNRTRTRLSMEWSNFVEVSWAHRPAFTVDRISRLAQRTLVSLETLVDRWVRIPHSRAYRLKQLEAAHEKAYEAYHPKHYSGAVTLVRAEHQPFGRAADSALGWDEYVEGEIEVIEAPGHRVGLLSEPRVRVVAQHIRRAMTGALTVSGTVE
jgi:thioesterase domain-containing protein